MFPATCPLSGTPPTAGPWPLARVAATQATEEIHDLAATVGVITAGPFPEPIETAFVLPLAAPSQPRLAGFLIVGLSPRRVLDAGYRSFLNLVAGHIATAIAEARAFEAERRRAEALAEIDRAKTAFFSNVSHEFRTPLTLMLGPLEDVLAGGRSSDLALIDTAHRNGLRLLKLVNTLLDFSRIEAGRAQASYEPVDLAALTADLASSFRSAIERAGLDFVVTTPPLPRPVHVDRDMWEKVVLKLLSNAFKFTFEGGIAVTLAPSPDGSAAVLEVRDTGTGIPAEELPRLFERFHRVAGARGRTFEGSGIGLALVQELVNLHGGTIAVESEEGRGSAFVV
jgi:signal transduction histidine kinase